LKNITLAPLHRLEDGINAVRVFMPKCWFQRGVDALKLYRSDYHSRPGAKARASVRLDFACG
jgi:hypothetical protein